MSISIVNQSIALDAHSPKKDAVVATGAPTVGDSTVAIWAGANVNPGLTQSIVGSYQALNAYALGNIQNISAVIQMPLGGGSADVVVDGTPDADSVMLYLGADIVAKQQSHFADRTVTRLIEAWLEA